MLEIWFRTGVTFLVLGLILGLIFCHSFDAVVDLDHKEIFQQGFIVHIFFATGIMLLSSRKCADTFNPVARHKICGLLLFGIFAIAGVLYALTFSASELEQINNQFKVQPL